MKIKDIYVYWGGNVKFRVATTVDDYGVIFYQGSGGCHYTKWQKISLEAQMLELFRYVHQAIWLYRVPIEIINTQLSQIDEMREYLGLPHQITKGLGE